MKREFDILLMVSEQTVECSLVEMSSSKVEDRQCTVTVHYHFELFYINNEEMLG